MVSHSANPNRKLAYTWELIEVNDTLPTWVGVNTALPNRVIKSALEAHLFPELSGYSQIRQEVAYGRDQKSRVDFLLTDKFLTDKKISAGHIDEPPRPIYVEVKNTTWVQGATALFPDTITTRGQKHLRELTDLLPASRAVMLYFINRGDCTQFAPGDAADQDYGALFRKAIAQGVEILPCRFDVTPAGIRYLGLAQLAIPTINRPPQTSA